jgi:hypothetical protein
VDLAGSVEQIDDMLKSLPRRYRDMAPATIEPDESGHVYVEAENICGQETKSKFAPGHDARMAGLVGWAEYVGADVVLIEDGIAKSGQPLDMIAEFGSATLRDKAAFIAENLAATPKRKTKKKAEKQPHERATIKVGRWEYDATIDPETKEATYISRDNGEAITISEGVYKLVEETNA